MRRWLCGLLLGWLLAGCAPGVVATSTEVMPVGRTAPAQAEVTATPPMQVTAGSAGVEATPGRDQAATEAVVFTRGGGITGQAQTWTIYTDGTIKLAAGDGAAAQALTGVTAEQVSALLAGLDALGFFDLSDAYGADDPCADCYHYSLTVTSTGRAKTVTTHDAARDAPPELEQALGLVKALLATAS
ncbi:MAG: hypothetical protein IT317_17850 [Anaerolineales bacterium]|nr:hypothetical protein [Anaerolineales bacterium]